MGLQEKSAAVPGAKIRTSSARRRKETLAGYLFTGPMLLGIVVFTLIPVIMLFTLSFTDWSFVTGYSKIRFIGFGNFIKLFQDDAFIQTLLHNLFLILAVPIGMAFALLFAVILTKHVYAQGFFKIIFFMPQISSVVAVAVVWQVLFHPSYGPVNGLLMSLGLDNPPKWLADTRYALPSVMMLMIWIDMGVSLIIYIAGINNIPQDLYEAAEMDGAKTWRKFKSITFPLLTPTSFFLLITGIIGSFKVFALIKVLTDGGPADSTSVIVSKMFQEGFVNLKTGYSSSMAVVLFAVVLLITFLQWIAQRKWVHE
ncbi:carbohydrate ABC transporter permease [Paenibacillus nasutitermitis]|uniref:ABC transporter permease n=1 Tax=Paenibacillus nasutitermitis TaxID=1652958 RepID=A0A916YQQ9_9BACL|nr:sugar ABC transporter permease [Paenibacillus nasutitermitis]GGD56672.1 ABC transporter permease [Paenibacillus nasutitermitis]